MYNILEHSFIARRLKAIERVAKENARIAKRENAGEWIVGNSEAIIGELRDIILYAMSGGAQPTPEFNESCVYFCNKECTDFMGEAYRNFGDNDTPNGIDSFIARHIKQIATELLQARNCLYRVNHAMYLIMGF